MPRPEPFDALIRAFKDRELLADLFHLLRLDEAEHPQTHSPDTLVLLVPACLDELLTKTTSESNEILIELLRWARPSAPSLNGDSFASVISKIRNQYAAFKKLEKLRTIPDEDNQQIGALLLELLPDRGAPMRLAAKTKAKVRQYFTTVLAYSRRTGKAILTRGRKFVRLLREKVAELEFPAKADAIVERKAAFGSRLFPFKGGRATKWFLVIALSIASFPYPIAGGVGLVLAFTDP